MSHRLRLTTPTVLAALLLGVLSGILLLSSDNAAHAQASPSVSVNLSANSVEPGTAITVTMSFGGLETDSDTSDVDYIFRADVKDSDNGDADACEDQAGGYGLGVDRYMHKVDDDPEVRTGTVSADCPAGDYTVRVGISDANNLELASASSGFSVAAPPPPLSTDATLSGLALSDVDIGAFDSATTAYTAAVANNLAETTVTPTTNQDGATYVVKLGGVTDGDGVIPLAVGENIITVEVTAEDGNTTQTYTVTVTRAAPGPAVAVALAPSGPVEPGTEITVTMSFANLEADSDTSDTDYIFRADVVDADQCENQDGGYGLGVDRYIYKVDEDPEVRAGTVSTDCPAGDYTVRVSVSSPDNVELAAGSANFTVNAPEAQQQTSEPQLSTDATLSGLTLSGVTLAFNPATAGYTADVANDIAETAVTATTNHDEATYVVKLGGVTDDDGTVSLAEGSNVITVEVTAEDGSAGKTYTVTVTRAAPLSDDATLSGLTLSGLDIGPFDPDITAYTAGVGNDVTETTVTPTVNDDGATYVMSLVGGIRTDGTLLLAAGSNVVVVEVTAEDGDTKRYYTVTVTRADPDYGDTYIPAANKVYSFEEPGPHPDLHVIRTIQTVHGPNPDPPDFGYWVGGFIEDSDPTNAYGRYHRLRDVAR